MEECRAVESCCRCQASGDSTELLPLWDGNVYCPVCIESASPELLRQAREHSILEDELPWNAKEHIRAILRLHLVITAVWVAVFAWICLPTLVKDGTAIFLGLLLIAASIGVLVFAIQGPIWFCLGRKTRPSMTLSNGTLTIKSPCLSRRCKPLCTPLEQWTWYEGKVKHDSSYRGLARRGQRAIVLVYTPPGGFLKTFFRYKLACGLTDERYAVWKAFLQVSGLREYEGMLRNSD
ncbi:MAG TPA: hypothetical protein DD670_19430 [Planctomycetaceae bacterium]|nr:hypothetical protein [Planctomycetaceae bacterium]